MVQFGSSGDLQDRVRSTLPVLFASVVSGFLVSGCAVFESPKNSQNQYTWDGPPSKPIAQYEWVQVSSREIQNICSFKYEPAEAGCVVRLYGHPNGPTCMIFSTLSEADAHRRFSVSLTGVPLESHWHHEVVEHCFNGKNHRIG